MEIPAGTHELGPANASLQVKTYREGVAAKAGHDLIIHVTRWQATIAAGPDGTTVELTADPDSLEIREGLRGVKPLTDKDRGEIRKNIREKILGTQQIAFRSRVVRPGAGTDRLAVEGDLTMAGNTRPVTAELEAAGGRLRGTIPVTQSQFGIKPYRGLMGALKVRDDVEVVVDAPLGAG